MKTQEPIKSFTAVTHNNKTYHFIITDDNKIYCCEFRIEYGANIIELKPNFVLRDKDSRTIYSLKEYLRELNNEMPEEKVKQQNLIKNYIIEPYVFNYLIDNKMVIYSHDMALLYGFDTKNSYDAHFKSRAFKKSRYKENKKILTKQKQGIFS